MKPLAFIRRARSLPVGEEFDWALALGDIALVLWLWFAAGAFTGALFPGRADGIWLSLGGAALSWRLGLHRRRAASVLLGRSVALVPALALLVFVETAVRGPEVRPAFALWLAAAAAVLFAAFRLAFRALRAVAPGQPLEILRWLIVAGAGTALMLPYYGRQGTGSGDAYWYVVMLADFVAQLHHGVFPVWVGQSEYAFNGAVSPLRLAPGFQYAGGGLDLLTAHRLGPLALKNALLCLTGLATAASAYLSLRAVLVRRPGLACLLALLWLASPCTLLPLGAASMYMQFMALMFLPPLLWGCCRLWERDDRASRLLIVSALAGMMLSHTPTALWGGLLAGGWYLGHALRRADWSAEARRIPWMAGLFLLLGAWPAGSALTIDHPVRINLDPAWVPLEIARAFPADLQPVRSAGDPQVGYALLAAGAAALVLLAWLRPRGSAALGAALTVLVALTFPIPWLDAAIWTHVPRLFITINNTAATGRLFEFLAVVSVFALAAAAADDRISGRRGRAALLLVALAGGAVWSATQAAKVLQEVSSTATDATEAEAHLRLENLALPRFAYASFATVPGYASHAHMEPLLENRLLDPRTLRVAAANADAAAPHLRLESAPVPLPRLVQSGLWRAASIEHGRAYRLTPEIRLQPGIRYALRVDFIHPEMPGQLQFISADLFRDYLLPDSGENLGDRQSPLAFGALPSSSGVAALQQRSGTVPAARLVLAKFAGEQFEFARFWLFSYSAEDLPVRVLSWIPYVAEADSAVPVYLETPRVWQRGWQADVNGRRVAARASPQNLVMIPLEAGASRVSLTFHAPVWLSAWFWLSGAGWAALLTWCVRVVLRKAAAVPEPPS